MDNLPNVPSDHYNMNDNRESAEEKQDGDNEPRSQVSTSTPAPRDNINEDLNSAFFCTLTKKVFEDPVVAEDGITYERSAIETLGSFSTSKLYPNRVLQAIIQDEFHSTSRLARDTPPRKTKHVDQEEPTSSLCEREVTCRLRQVRECYCCPITMSVLQVPVIDPDGNTFERDAIHQWIRTHGTSPITRTALCSKLLYNNTTLAYALQELITDSKMIKFDPPASMQYLQIEPTMVDESGDVEEGTAESTSSTTNTNSNDVANSEQADCDWIWDAARDFLRVAFFTFVACGSILFWAHYPQYVVLLFVPVLVSICLLVDAMSNE